MPTIDDQVVAAEDDGFTEDGVLQDPGDIYTNTNSSVIYSGWRFVNMTLPANAQITVAYITLRQSTADDDCDWNIHCEENRTPLAITSLPLPEDRVRTTNSTYWLQTGMVHGQWYNSPSIVNVIQELVDDTAGWTAGDDLCILGVDPNSNWNGRWNGGEGGANGGKIHIEYEEGVANVYGPLLQVV